MAVKLDTSDNHTEPIVTPTLAEDATTTKIAFLSKAKRIDTTKVKIPGDNGELVEYEIKIQALDKKVFRVLQAEHPPRRNNAEDASMGVNTETFPPALFAASVIDPKLTLDEWTDVWNSPNWSPGELGNLLDLAWATSNRGLDVNFGVPR